MDGGESGESKKEDKVTSSGRTEIHRVKIDRHRQTDRQTHRQTDALEINVACILQDAPSENNKLVKAA